MVENICFDLFLDKDGRMLLNLIKSCKCLPFGIVNCFLLWIAVMLK